MTSKKLPHLVLLLPLISLAFGPSCQSTKSSPAQLAATEDKEIRETDLVCIPDDGENYLPAIVIKGETVYLLQEDLKANYHLVSQGKVDRDGDTYSSKDAGLKKLELFGKLKTLADVETDHRRFDASCDSTKQDIKYVLDTSSGGDKEGKKRELKKYDYLCERDGGPSRLPTIAIKDDHVYLFKDDDHKYLHLIAKGKVKKDGHVYESKEVGLIKLDIFDKKDGHGDVETKHDRYDVVCSEKGDHLDYIDDRANPLD